jgi:hypothetical protein
MIKPNMQVVHETHGEGVVYAVLSEGTVCDVVFGGGRKKVLTSQLTRVDTRPAVPVDGPLSAKYSEHAGEPTNVAHDNDGQRGSTWRPTDLGPYLRGEVKRPEPTIGLTRADGLCLLYPGREHTVIGEMESGKSWFCAASAAAELVRGNRVLYVHFEEADPTDTVERLQALGVPDGKTAELFAFVGPNEPVDSASLAALLDPAPVLVILDGVNEAMSLHGQAIREEDGAAAYRRRLVKPCTAAGAAVLSADHVVKDKEKRGRSPLGSIHKGNGLTGSLISLENVEPFGRHERGCSHVFVTKDRPGHLRQHGNPNRKEPGKTYIGSLIVDDTRTRVPHLDLTFTEPPSDVDAELPEEMPTHEVDDELVFGVVTGLVADTGQPVSVRGARAQVHGISDRRVDAALERLVHAGRLIERPGPRRSRLFATVAGAATQPVKPEGP